MQPHLRHFCSRGTETARHCPSPRSRQPLTARSRACWTTSPSVGACPRPHPRAACLGSSQVTASGCPCGSLSDTAASPCWPSPRSLQGTEEYIQSNEGQPRSQQHSPALGTQEPAAATCLDPCRSLAVPCLPHHPVPSRMPGIPKFRLGDAVHWQGPQPTASAPRAPQRFHLCHPTKPQHTPGSARNPPQDRPACTF